VFTLVAAILTAGVSAPAPATELADPAIERRAEAIATEAKLLFQQQLFETAAERFMEAYTLVRRPTLIYNAARAYEQAGQSSKALAMFRAYRDLPEVQPDGKADADLHIGRLAAEIKAKEAEAAAKAQEFEEQKAKEAVPAPTAKPLAPVETPPAQPEAPKPLTQPKPAIPLVPTATAVGLAVVSGVLFVLAKDQESQARDIENAGFRTTQDKTEYLDHAANAKGLQGAAIAGSALAACAFGWLAWELYSARQPEPIPGTRSEHPPQASHLDVRLLPAAGGTGVSLDVRF